MATELASFLTTTELWAALLLGWARALQSLPPATRQWMACGMAAWSAPLHGKLYIRERGGWRYRAQSLEQPRPLSPCQSLSKLQELVRYHVYNHGQVRAPLGGWPADAPASGPSEDLSASLWPLGPMLLPAATWTPQHREESGDQGGSRKSPGRDWAWPRVARCPAKATIPPS